MEYKYVDRLFHRIDVLTSRFNYCCWIIQEIIDGIYPHELLDEWLKELDRILEELTRIESDIYG